jgi:hypothetical protein
MESKYTITRIRNSRKDIQNNGKKLEETNGVIRSHKSEKDIQHYGPVAARIMLQ